MEDSYIYKNQKKLRWGYTTGTCAAAASLAAAVMLLRGTRMERAPFTTPGGIRLELDVEEIVMEADRVSCCIRKDAGDDPDVTDGLAVYSALRRGKTGDIGSCGDYVYESDTFRLILSGGVGIGRVTKGGLSCEVGKPAINPAPRQMIFGHVADVCRDCGFTGVLHIEISAPDASRVADRTFNGRLGILGGISILGTSGVVEPMSETALLETIRLELRQKVQGGEHMLLVTPGNYGEAYAYNVLGLGLGQAVKCSNFIGNTIDMAVEEGARELLLIGHGGKLIKLAAGIMNTHSLTADGRAEILAAYAAACGAGQALVEQILEAVTVDGGLRLLESVEGLRAQVMARVMDRLEVHLKRRAGQGLKAEAIMFTNERGTLGVTSGAREMLCRYRNRIATNERLI